MELHALVLAGGAGSRFGGRKLLAPWKGGVLLNGALKTAIHAPVKSVTLVTGADADDVAAAARAFVESCDQQTRLCIVHAFDHHEGLAASLRAGLDALPETSDGAFIFLGDMPLIPATILPVLADSLSSPGILAAAPVHAGRRGHPVLISRLVFSQMAALTGDVGARKILDQLGPSVAAIPTGDPGVLLDIDVPEDLGRAGADMDLPSRPVT
ncbi:nucleotidyltransferase family protein [Microvirga sp. 2TAF3]|uniref:nucleotidyltransferase family protein n=1 Tax=Microvirga sp. 2TAF3 TaxID=3233014 RepID=UPI003F9CFC97